MTLKFIPRLVSLLGLAWMLLLFVTPAKAQCPDDLLGIPPSVVTYPWSTTSIHIQLPGTDCWITINSCYRTIEDGVKQVWISEVIPDDDGGCDGISNEVLISLARDLV